MQLSVICSIIYNSQDLEPIWMAINRGMDIEGVVHIYNRILLIHKKNEIMTLAETWRDLGLSFYMK